MKYNLREAFKKKTVNVSFTNLIFDLTLFSVAKATLQPQLSVRLSVCLSVSYQNPQTA